MDLNSTDPKPNWEFQTTRSTATTTPQPCLQCGPSGYGNYSRPCAYPDRAGRNIYDAGVHASQGAATRALRDAVSPECSWTYNDLAESGPEQPSYGGRYWGDLDPTRARPYGTAGKFQHRGYNTNKLYYERGEHHPDAGCSKSSFELQNGDFVAGLAARRVTGMQYEMHKWPQPDEVSYCAM